ncbi:hypothetical protein [Wolbachia endosymbiont of Onchocerca volvulus]|uniref:hypothetical protein n=1 Tax=Onchocerca volvulus endobacterium TaxID=77551 RepID=UPI00046CC834|nr:hypothetical protein [Wolbachia endosymbiont of Onchocerca volvulus]
MPLEQEIQRVLEGKDIKERQTTQVAQIVLADKAIKTAVRSELKQDQNLKGEARNELLGRTKQKVNDLKQLEASLEVQKDTVQQSKKNTELEAKSKFIKQSKASMYTASVCSGLVAGLAVFTALGRTVRLDMWVVVSIVVASTLAVSGVTYFVLEPSTQASETQSQKINKEGYYKVLS